MSARVCGARRRMPLAMAALAAVLSAAHPATLIAQAGPGADSLENLTSRAREAISRSQYESAVKILTEAKTRYPASPRASLALGDLYYDKELFALALDEYRSAEKKGATDFVTLTQISRCYGKLNQERSSIDYLTRILQQYPDSADTMDDLGWMYFKTHQLDKGESVLLKGIAKVGAQRGLTMTLGTIYSGMNRYAQSREYYQKAVDDALRVGDRNFAAIAYYNLSLLEHNFFHFNSALRFTDESIAMEDRPSGHLARGELLQSRMDFAGAEQEFQSAYARDTTPLSKVNLAILYQKFGKLDLARRYAEEVMRTRDLAWLSNYGTDTTRHYKDMHELLALIDRGLAEREARRPTTGPLDRAGALAASLRWRVEGWFHAERFRLYSLESGRQFLAHGSEEDAWWEFYRGNERYGEVALKYLAMARAIETARAPHAAVYYAAEEGKVRRSPELLQRSVTEFDTYWEREPAADALIALVPLLRDPGRRRESIVSLYGINPGALPQAGIGLPLTVELGGSGWTARERAALLRFLRRSGSECAPGMRHVLLLSREGDGGVRWSVTDTVTGGTIRSGRSTASGRPLARAAALVKTILEELYSVH